MSTNYPSHPVFSWRPTIVGSLNWDDGVTTGTINLASDVAATYWGWSSDGSDNAQADSIQGRLAALLTTATTATVTAAYTWPDGTAAPPVTAYTSNVTLDLDFTTDAAAQQFGFPDTSTFQITNLIAKSADFTDAGHWQPSCYGGYDERWDENPNVGITESLDGSTRKLRTWGASLTSRAFMAPSVLVANIRSDAAAEASQATAAQRDVADPNSLLEMMVQAARSPENTDDARAFRVFTAAGVYRTCYFVDPSQVTAIESLCSNASARRVWGVSFVMRDDG